jgi:hypothetical protein
MATLFSIRFRVSQSSKHENANARISLFQPRRSFPVGARTAGFFSQRDGIERHLVGDIGLPRLVQRATAPTRQSFDDQLTGVSPCSRGCVVITA